MEYKPISREEILSTLVAKFGGVETARYYLNSALSDLQTIEVGISENNPLLASKPCESLRENLMNLRSLLDKKEYKPSVEGAIKGIDSK